MQGLTTTNWRSACANVADASRGVCSWPRGGAYSADGRPSASVSPGSPPAPGPTSHLDAGTVLACRKFEPLAHDANAGRRTNAEFREGIKQVYEQARVFPDSEVTAASQRLLQVLTIGSSARALREEFLDLAQACQQ